MAIEFYCNASTGNNLNAGTPIGGIYPVTTTNGAYTQGGGAGGGTSDRYTAASGTPFSGINIGDYVSIYNDGAGAPTPYVAYVSAINGGGASIDVDSTRRAGTRAATVASGKTAKVGGEWLGPNGASGFPFNFITSIIGTPFIARVNLKNNATYNITASMTHTAGVAIFSGYSASAGDGGRATIDGGTTGASYILLNNFVGLLNDLIFQHNGATGTADGLAVGSQCIIFRVTTHDVKGNGFTHSGTIRKFLVECEAYNCGVAGFVSGSRAQCIRCYAHNNTGAGFAFAAGQGDCLLLNCIADSNGTNGIAAGVGPVINCDTYNNGTGSGIVTQDNLAAIQNCNAAKNGSYGVAITEGGGALGTLDNCGFGSGADANTTAPIYFDTKNGVVSSNIVNYGSPTNPWKSASTGDFRLISKQALGSGAGNYTQVGSKTGTLDYPDIGAVQHQFIPPRKII